MSTDVVHRFSFMDAPIRGQWVRLENVLEELYAHQPYPPAVRRLLGEMLGAAAMLADGIKLDGSVTLHSHGGDGPVNTLMVECRSQHLLRGIARWDQAVTPPESATMSELLGNGQLAISLLGEPPGRDRSVSYQGLVGLEQGDFARNLEGYFATSEQLPSRLFFAWGASSLTGLLLQRLPAPDNATEIELDRLETLWQEVGLLAATVTEAELAALPPAKLLGRLFDANALNLNPPRHLRFECTCSREKTVTILQALGRSELLELLESEGEIEVTCEVCGQAYRYDAVDTHQLLEPGDPQIH